MTTCSTVDWGAQPPVINIPRTYNAASDFVDRNIAEGRGDKIAFIDDRESVTYAELSERVSRAGNALKAMGLGTEDRIMMVMLDTIDFPVLFFGAIKAGIIPIPVNTLLTSSDYAYMLQDSRAKALFVSDALYPTVKEALPGQPWVRDVVISGQSADDLPVLSDLVASADKKLATADTIADEACFWLYSSGSTGRPKGAVHIHSDMVNTAVLYGSQILKLTQKDVVFSAAKLFFAYGLGNGMTFPMFAGGTAVLMAERPTPEAVMKRINDHDPAIFYGVPTLYAAMLADPAIKAASSDISLRACVSAGEALPKDVGDRWNERFGVPIVDGIGSTEMLHIFLSNRPDAVKYGTTGTPVPGYEMKLTDESGAAVGVGEVGDLWVKGPSTAVAYWNNREKSTETFHGPWTRTGDKYLVDDDGCYVYQGRSDDMLKVSGIWVSPFEVESALAAHPAVLEAAIVGRADDDELIKPEAYVLLADGHTGGETLEDELKNFVKDRLAPYKYPRWIQFVDELPKTATGKTQRFKLRS